MMKLDGLDESALAYIDEAAKKMTLSEYRLWWYKECGMTPPTENEQLTVSQRNDERLIREGYEHRRKGIK